MTIKKLGDRLKESRKAKGFNQKELADLLNTTQGYISEIESGKVIPGGEFLLSLKQFLKYNNSDGESNKSF